MIEIIPAIDIIEGKCVRLEQGNYQTKKVYSENPVEVAKKFEDAGLKRLHLIDLDGAKAKSVVNLKVLSNIASTTNLKIDFGGGIKTNDDIKKVFDNGADMVTVGSIAVTDLCMFETWIDMYGGEKIILGADVNDYKIAITGWLNATDIDLFDFLAEKIKIGIKKVLCTDITKDGMLKGPSFDLYKNIKQLFADLHIIASGGISSLKDIEILDNSGVNGVVIGKAIYENKIKLSELEELIKKTN